MVQIIKWCKYCKNVISINRDPEITEDENDYDTCKTCEKKVLGKSMKWKKNIL